jgi:hypothetical protein
VVVERVAFILHLSVAALTAAAAAIFTLAEGSTGIPALPVVVAILAFFLVDRSDLLRVPNLALTILALVGFAAAAFEFLVAGVEAPLLAGGHLLSYLTCVYLLQPKSPRIIWSLCALSLLQVAISSLLTFSPWFGLVMPVFLMLALWTLAVFQLHRTLVPDSAGDAAINSSRRTDSDASRRLTTFVPSTARRVTAGLEQEHWITGRFALSVAAGTGLSLVIAAAFFVLIPRVWIGGAPVFFDGGRPVGGSPARTGYTPNITLGHIGDVQESSRIALEARLFDNTSDRQLRWQEWAAATGRELVFRGSVQELYEDGSWKRWDGERMTLIPLDRVRPLGPAQFRQHLKIYSNYNNEDGDVVFISGLPSGEARTDSDRDLLAEWGGWTQMAAGKPLSLGPVEFEYAVNPGDLWFPNSLGAVTNRPSNDFRQIFRSYLRLTDELPADLARGLERWTASRQELLLPDATNYELARAWETWFIDSPDFEYSLSLAIEDPALDPVLDFLENTRRGHCEYYASALALLLRTRGIPTRVVSGFKGGQEQGDGTLVVRDLHAHLWVEAYVEDAPEDPVTGQVGPRWITLDPTPAARDAEVQRQERESESFWGRLQSFWLGFWNSSIRMSHTEQQSLIYDPLRGAAKETWSGARGLFSGEGWARLKSALASPEKWFSWKGGAAATLLFASICGLIWLSRRAMRLARLRYRRSQSDAAAVVDVPFFRRLMDRLGRAGWNRKTSQTPREFATQLAGAESLRTSGSQTLPPLLTERYYAARFGDRPISEPEAEQLDQQVDQLVAAVEETRRQRR